MINYKFSITEFEQNFKVKKGIGIAEDVLKLTHKTNNKFRLFPYKATRKQAAPIITHMVDVIGVFLKYILDIETEEIEYEKLCNKMASKLLDMEEDEKNTFQDIVRILFFGEKGFTGSNIGTYIYQSPNPSKKFNDSVEDLAFFLFYNLGIDEEICRKVKLTMEKHSYNAMEKLVFDSVDRIDAYHQKSHKRYFTVVKCIQGKMKRDFQYMLDAGMTSREDIANLLELYYFFYVSQTCLELNHFCQGQRERVIPLYFALDWEKVNKNRKCYTEGWATLQAAIQKIFSHAVTLELINQHDGDDMYDYIFLNDTIKNNPDKDLLIAEEINKAADAYIACIGDWKQVQMISFQEKQTKTESAIEHLFQCVNEQFNNPKRNRANEFYAEKFCDFCKEIWLKDRKKAGYVLNLKERHIVFLTKICLRDSEKMRLVELFEQFKERGIYLDQNSKSLLQEFYLKMNLIDKKSDSGDAQYVKRIL